jgi:hypothetical protein
MSELFSFSVANNGALVRINDAVKGVPTLEAIEALATALALYVACSTATTDNLEAAWGFSICAVDRVFRNNIEAGPQ